MIVELPTHAVRPAAAIVASARELTRLGRYLDAQALIEPLEATGSVSAGVLASRIVGHLGARRGSEARALRLWRAHRDDAEALVEMVRGIAYRRGPYRAWCLINDRPLPAQAPSIATADWHSLRAFVLGTLRDFDGAARAHAQALEIASDEAWIHVEWAYVCEQCDQYDAALASAERALAMSPSYRAAVQAVARLYTLVGRDDEAVALLSRFVETSQSGGTAIQLFELQMERGDHSGAQHSLEVARRCSPLAEKSLAQWFDCASADIALALGRHDEARELALRIGGDFHERLAKRLAGPEPQGRRVQLPVGFVRQHALTCAPATLTTLSRYWNRHASHLEIAEKICYDGTPNHSERQWSEEQGFVTREFTVDWTSARALLDAGIPFTLTTVSTGSAHLQAAIGYDALRGTLLIRDPFKRTHNEVEAQALFDSHRSNGPRGMVLLPPEQANRLEGIDLPEASVWDGYHTVMSALSRHRRQDAEAALARMQESYAEHRMTLQARRVLACYDNDPLTELSLTEQLIERFADDTSLRLAKASLLSMVASRDQQSAWWMTFEQGRGADAVALTRRADFLCDDGREHLTVRRLYTRALDVIPTHAAAWAGLARITWQRGDRELACELSRIAACLHETNESLAEMHFRTCRFLGKAQQGIDFLKRRVERLATKSSAPVMTLFSQLDAVERTTEAFQVLEQGLAVRPQDGGLMLFAADAHLRYGNHAQARELIERAEPHAYRPAWLRLNARWLRESLRPDEALERARQAIEIDPRDVSLHELIGSLLSQREGREPALDHLRRACEAQPHHLDLQQMFVGWLGASERDEAIAVLERVVRSNPAHAWAHRELAFKLSQAGRHDEAWQAASAALAVSEHQTHTHSTLGHVRMRQGQVDEARRHLRDAIVLSVDNDYAIDALVDLEQSLDGRREALAFVRSELERQVTLGDGLLTYQRCAQTVLDDHELLGVLEAVLAVRDDLWQAWAAVAIQRLRTGQHTQAIELLSKAIALFPLLPRLHVEQARAATLSGNRESAREMLMQALRIAPGWDRPVRMFVETVMDEAVGYERALPVLDAALHRNPENADLRALRARIRLRMGDRDAARVELESALQHDPSLRWGWELLDEMLRGSGENGATLALAQRVSQQHPGNVFAWLRVADYAPDTESALAAIERALALEPRNETAFDAKLSLLNRARRYDEVSAALAAAPWPEGVPVNLAAYEARVAYAKGDTRHAVDLMRSLLRRDQSQYWLWKELADWLDQLKEDRPYLEAAGHMVRLAPNHSVAHGFLGHAHLKCREPDAARRHFARAIELDPGYLFAGVHLADLQIEARDHAAAQATLAGLRAHHQSSVLALRELRIAAAQSDEVSARRAFAEIASRRDDAAAICEEAIQHMSDAGWKKPTLEVIEQVFSRGPCARAACRHWLAKQEAGWLPGSHIRLLLRALATDPSRSLLSEVLNQLASQPDAFIAFWVQRRFGDAIREDAECWGVLGYMHLSHGRFRRVVRCMADWRERAHPPAWALDNLAVALRVLGRDQQAREVSEASLRLEPRNNEALAWLAVDAAVGDRLDELRALLLRIDESTPREFFQLLIRALRAYLHAASASDSRLALVEYGRLRNSTAPRSVHGRLLRRLRNQLVWRHTPPLSRPWRWLQFRAGQPH